MRYASFSTATSAAVQSSHHSSGLINKYRLFIHAIPPCVLAVHSVPYCPHHRIQSQEANAIWITADRCGGGKGSLNGFLPAIKCFRLEVTPITYSHNSLVGSSHMALPQPAEHQEMQTYQPPRRQRAQSGWWIVLMIIKWHMLVCE